RAALPAQTPLACLESEQLRDRFQSQFRRCPPQTRALLPPAARTPAPAVLPHPNWRPFSSALFRFSLFPWPIASLLSIRQLITASASLPNSPAPLGFGQPTRLCGPRDSTRR